jgi:MauM/NapG family ferredoxin protein
VVTIDRAAGVEKAMKTAGKNSIGRKARITQAISLLFFWFLLLSAAWPTVESLPPSDSFLHMDPLAAILTPLVAREWEATLVPGIAILALCFVAGRFFCGWLCPFGATLTFGRKLLRRKPLPLPVDKRNIHHIKFFVLACMFGAAILGINDFHWGTPIPLITRFYAMVLHPLGLFLSQLGLTTFGQSIFTVLDMHSLQYVDIQTRHYSGLYFLLIFFGALFWLEYKRPRFWCRCLCPAGALLALASQRPLLRRRVDDCRQCSTCVNICPMEAIDRQDARVTRHGECAACLRCSDVCPSRNISFTPWGNSSRNTSTKPAMPIPAAQISPTVSSLLSPLPSRRAFLGYTGMGLLLAGARNSGVYSLLAVDKLSASSKCIRPPGSVPEQQFLDLCLRCGACMKICPSNALQPTWTAAGLDGMFSPILIPRQGPCVPACNACGQVCPTQAIRNLPLEEKRWARVGTAVIQRNVCLAWAENRSCVVCQEVCPYGAVKLQKVEKRTVAAPVVNANRCYGCGYCEYHCPVAEPAIAVTPLNAIRLNNSLYKQTARSVGLDFTMLDTYGGQGVAAAVSLHEGDLPPGFSE